MRSASCALLTGFLLSLSLPAFAVYKCETDGKTSYGDAPCASGKLLDISNPSAAETDAARARQQLAQEKSTLKRLENDRHKREAKEEKEQQRIARAWASKEKKCGTLARRKKWAAEDAASSSARAAEKNKLRARRLTEQYESECPK